MQRYEFSTTPIAQFVQIHSDESLGVNTQCELDGPELRIPEVGGGLNELTYWLDFGLEVQS